mmetsp:Transcript_41777/g.131718  ORF Transcript_41777/g.131718 Transcript_41777/m.131718 type:complete len:537 (-) Transcript_41777:187-1797(-)
MSQLTWVCSVRQVQGMVELRTGCRQNGCNHCKKQLEDKVQEPTVNQVQQRKSKVKQGQRSASAPGLEGGGSAGVEQASADHATSWMDQIIMHVTTYGPCSLTELGMLVPRPPGERRKLSESVRSDARLRLTETLEVSLSSSGGMREGDRHRMLQSIRRCRPGGAEIEAKPQGKVGGAQHEGQIGSGMKELQRTAEQVPRTESDKKTFASVSGDSMARVWETRSWRDIVRCQVDGGVGSSAGAGAGAGAGVSARLAGSGKEGFAGKVMLQRMDVRGRGYGSSYEARRVGEAAPQHVKKWTHFVSLPIVNPCVLERVAQIQQRFTAAHPTMKDGMSKLTKLHVTLAVLRCADDDAVSRVRQALQARAQDIVECMKDRKGTAVCCLKLQGLSMFSNRYPVLWIKVLHDGFLPSISCIVREAVKSSGTGVTLEMKASNFHITIWKSSKMGVPMVDSSTLLSSLVYKENACANFGEENLVAVHLCAMTKEVEEGEGHLYKVDGFIRITLSYTCLPSVVTWNSNHAKDYQKTNKSEPYKIQG